MTEFFSGSTLFAMLLTFGTYEVGRLIQKKTGVPALNPILIAAMLCGVVLVAVGMPNQVYQSNCEAFSWLLTPATVCLAIPLYAQFSRLRHDLPAILAGVTAGTFVSMGFVWVMARLCNLGDVLTASLLPKSITTAMGIVVSESTGGEPAVTTAAIILTGILGSIFGPWLCKVLRLYWPAAQGVAFGTSAHVIGTSKAAEINQTAEAVSSLSLVFAGILTAIICPLVL